MPLRFLLPLAVLLALGGAPAAGAQLGSVWVPLDDGAGPPDFPFGLAVSPDARVYHVAVAGTFSSPNRRVAVVDRALRQVVNRLPVGRFPEEIAYETAPAIPPNPPTARRIFVTNSADSTVSVLDGSGNPVKTLALGSSEFPFGIAMDPAGRTLAVTTKNGRVFLLDVKNLAVSSVIPVAGFHGRATFLADGRLLFASAVPVGQNLTDVRAVFLDPKNPAARVTVDLFGPALGFPSAEDVAIVRDGREAWFPLQGADRSIRRVDLQTGAVIGGISLKSQFPSGALHGIGASGEGHVLVTSLGNGENHVVLLETRTPAVVSSLVLPLGRQPNDAVFTPDAREAAVTMQWDPSPRFAGIHILTGLPVPPIRLQSDTVRPPVGGSFRLLLRGAAAFSTSVIGLSLTGSGPTRILGFRFALSPPILPLWIGPHDVRGRLSPPPFVVPNAPALRGARLWLQALVQEQNRSLRISNPLELVIQ